MKLQLVTFEQAKVLKELGFPQEFDTVYIVKECYEDNGNYGHKHNIGDLVYSPYGLSRNEVCDAPTLELVAKWLREEKNIEFIHLEPSTNNQRWNYRVETTVYSDYEEALSAGIDKAIEILKNNE